MERVVLPRLDAERARMLLSNPFYIRDQAGLTQSSGWIDAWRSAPSVYVVRPTNAAETGAVIRFAERHNLRLVIKGGGHSYLGGSNAPDSLLLWTRDLNHVELHDAFTPSGSSTPPVPAVSVGAGCIWHDVYEAVTTKGGRYVQGGGCTTVGVAGLVQGGGFGSFSKGFGIAAAGLLEAEIVTADSVVRTVNAEREPELFWALKGGGGGTFGVVTRLTLRTHALPATFGVVHWSIKASSDSAFLRLLERFTDHYAQRLLNPHWGEQASARPGNRFEILMLFQGLDGDQARADWQPMIDFVVAHPDDYHVDDPILILPIPAQRFWDVGYLREHLRAAIAIDERQDGSPANWWWAGNTGEAGAFWHGYESVWLPMELLQAQKRSLFAEAWFNASRQWSTTLHFNKGLGGASEDAISRSRETAMNPQVLEAFALAIIAMDGPSAFSPLPAPDLAAARKHSARIHAAMHALRAVAPEAGCYLSECDYHLSGWQRACWGEHWDRLAQLKRRYDPSGLFFVHHAVGSEEWSADGFTSVK